MEDPSKAQEKEKMERIGKTSKYNKDEIMLQRTMIIILLVLTILSIILGVTNIALFLIDVRIFPLATTPSWLTLTSKDILFYVWAAAGIYSFLGIIEGVIGLQITDGKQNVARAYVFLGPVGVLMALGQLSASALLFAAHFEAYSVDLGNSQFLFSIIDIVIAISGFLIALWILVVWFIVIRKRRNPSPKKSENRDENEEYDESDYDSEESDEEESETETETETETEPESDVEKEKPKKKKTQPVNPRKRMVNPVQKDKKGVFIPMPPRGGNQPRVIVINPKMRRPTQIPTLAPPFRPPYGLRQNVNPYPPMRGPLPIAPPLAPYQTPYRPLQQQYPSPYQAPQVAYQFFSGRNNLPLAYQPRY